MKLIEFEEKIHSVKLLQIIIVACLYFFIVENICFDFPAFVLVFGLMVWAGVSFRKSVQILIGSIIFSLSFFLVVIISPSKDFAQTEKFHFLFWDISQKLFNQQLIVFVRIVCISTVSIMSVYLLNYEKVFIYLMKKKLMPVRMGYPLILAFNSLGALKSELEKININAKFRGISLLKRINILFPLLVYSIRHAERGALSLVTRGMNEDKSFYFDTEVRIQDRLITFFVVIFHLVLVVFYFYTLK